MEPFFYALCMLFGAAFVLALAVLFVASFGVFLLASFKKWRIAQIISAICFVTALPAGALFTYIFILDPAPERVFAEAFRQSVPEDVQNMQCHTLWMGDCHMTWLKFETNENEYQKLVPAELLNNSDLYSNFSSETGGPNAPDWWIPKTKADTSYYSLRRSPGRIYGGERTFMT